MVLTVCVTILYLHNYYFQTQQKENLSEKTLEIQEKLQTSETTKSTKENPITCEIGVCQTLNFQNAASLSPTQDPDAGNLVRIPLSIIIHILAQIKHFKL